MTDTLPPLLTSLVMTDALRGWPDDPPALTWEPFNGGITAHWLYRTGPDGPAAAFLRYEPGAAAPLHAHDGFEHILVLKGAQEDDRGRYEAGSLVINPPGTSHRVTSPEGCVVLIIWERPVRFL